jgi:hypothetical protein
MEDDELKIPTNVQLFPTEDLLNNFLNKKRKSSNDELSSSCYTERDFGITSNYNIYSKYFLLDNKNTTNHSTHSSVMCDKESKESENEQQLTYQSYSVDISNSCIQKKKLFQTLRDAENEQKQKKLLLNRISAKKSRTKKKNYVLKLEEELKQIKREIAETKRRCKYTTRKRSKQLSNTNSQSNSVDMMTTTSNSDQKVSVFHHMIQLLKCTMPISLKVYKDKFLKMEEFDFSCENVDTLIQKNRNNINILNELYSFESGSVNNMESIAYKLYAYYIKVGDVLNSFKVNYDLL